MVRARLQCDLDRRVLDVASRRLDDSAISTMAFSPDDQDTILAGTTAGGVFRPGDAVTVLPAMAVPVENRRGQLALREFAPKTPGRTLVLGWRKGSALKTALDAVAATIRDGLAAPARTRRPRP